MKTFCIFITMFSLCLFTATAQHQLSGTVKDREGAPVPYATAALLRPDSSMITGVTTNDAGRFVLENVKASDYLLQISFIGYQKEYRTAKVPEQSDLGEITLSESVNRLKEVVVEGRRALVEQKLDRIVVNVAGNMITAGSNVNEVLKQLPGLIVDGEGNIKLNGREATVYIDGRPTRLPAVQVAQMLNGMQGDMVDRVELISNPSSRYEAGMSSAIVNIRLKRDASLGVNGSVTAGIGYTEHDRAYRGSANLNYRSGKLNIFGNYGYNDQPEHIELWQRRNYNDDMPVTYDQYSVSDLTSPGNTLRAGVDWFVSPKQTIGFLFNGTLTDSDRLAESEARVLPANQAAIDSTVLSDIRQKEKYSSQMYNLNYRLTLSEGEELTADADYGRVYNHNWMDMQNRYCKPADGELRIPTEFQHSGPRSIDILSLKLDYVKPLSENSKLEAGIKTGQILTDNEIKYENLHHGQWIPDYNQSNHFKYSEQITAAYAACSHRFGKLSAMAGLRAEYTSTKGESVTMDTAFTRSYLDWFPSAYLQYRINDKQGLNLSYSRKITRPGYSLLNPFRYYIDPFTYSSGNPDLGPAYYNTVELRWFNQKGFAATISYDTANGLFEKDAVQDDATHTTNIIHRNNGKKESVTLGISAPVQIAEWYNLQTYAQASWNMVDTRYNGEQFLNDYLGVYVGMHHTFTISPTLKATIQMMWVKPGWDGNIRFENDIYSMDARVEKTFFNRRLTLALACNDLFSSIVYNVSVKFQNIDQVIKEDHYMRRTMLTIRYNFGSQKIRSARNRSVGIEDEVGRAK